YILPALLMTAGGLYLIPYIAIPGMRSLPRPVTDHFAELVKTIDGAFILYNYSGLILLVFLVVLALLAARPKALFVLLCGTAGILYVLAFVRLGDMRHRGLLLLEIIA